MKEETLEKLITLLVELGAWFVLAGFTYWGWSVLAPHLNAPIFTFWEIMGIRVGLACTIQMFRRKKE